MWPLAAGQPRLWQIDDLVATSERTRAALASASSGFSVQAPVEELRAAQAAATTAGRRLLLVGGEAAALLFAFAVLAARTMRRDLEAARRRLTWYGARRWHLRLLTLAESATVAVVGTVVGWLVGLVVGALAAGRAGAPVGGVLRESVLAPPGARARGGRRRSPRPWSWLPRRRCRCAEGGRFGPLDAAALGALAIVVAALAGGAADGSQLGAGPGLRARPAPPARPDRLRRRRRRRAAVRAARARRGPAAPSQRRGTARRGHARARAGRGGGDRRVPDAGLRARAARRGLPGHARPGRGRPGLVRGAARRPRARGLQVARPRARRGAPAAVRRDRGRHHRRPGRAAAGERRQRRGRQRRHRPRPAGPGDRPRARLAQRLRRPLACLARLGRGSPARLRAAGRQAGLAAHVRGRAGSALAPRAIVAGRDGRFSFVELGPLQAGGSTRVDRAAAARGSAAARCSGSSSCRHGSSTAAPTPAARSRAVSC